MNINNVKKVLNELDGDKTLVAVTKNQSIDDVKELELLGVNNFGENKLQELLKKKEHFPNANWHFIGRIQSNKIKDMVHNCVLIHSVASIKHLSKINLEASKINKVQDILVQINNTLFKHLQLQSSNFDILSMGMSNDYKLAIQQGSNCVRIGSLLFK